jgi:hypothetical protein
MGDSDASMLGLRGDELEASPVASGELLELHRFPTLRSVLIGCVMCALIGLAGPYWTIYLQTSRLFADYHTAGATFFIFVLFVLFNVALAFVWRRFALKPGELMAIGAMMLVGGSIVTSGLIAYFIPSITSVYNLANPSNPYREELWPLMPKALAPLDPNGGILGITRYWTGLRAGENLPWQLWVGPLVVWGIFLMALFACMMAIMSIMRKQWVDYEHLSFPIAQVPMELCVSAGDPRGAGSIFRSRAFWLGTMITFLLASIGGVVHYATGGEAYFRIRHTLVFVEGTSWQLPVYLDIVVLGLVFLIPNRVAFTVWFVTLVSWFMQATLNSYNLVLPDSGVAGGEMSHFAMGATIVFVVASVWLSRRHLSRAFLCAFRLGERDYDRGEPSSYLTAFIVILVGLVVCTAWLTRMGLRLHYSLLLVLVTLAIYFTMARVVAQCGLPMLSPPIYPHNFMAGMFGSSSFSAGETVVLGSHMGWHFDMRNSVMSGSGHGMYMTRSRRRGLFWAMLLGLLVTYVAGCLCAVWIGYRYGGANMDPWFYGNFPRLPWNWASGAIEQHTSPSFGRMAWAGGGAAIMTVLVFAQRTLFWWPLHPVGLLVCSSHMVRYFWFSVFMGWLTKVLLTSFAGPSAFRPARRFFIGSVMGFFLAGGTWAIIDTVCRETNNPVFYI